MARVALVTGGTRGIGAAISGALKEQGRTVVANYAGNDAAAEAFHAETGIRVMKFDVSDFDACQDAVDRDRRRRRADRDPGEQRRHHPRRHAGADDARHVGCRARYRPRLLLQPVQADVRCDARRASSAAIVNIGSVNGQAGQYGQVNYAAAKSGIHGFTKALAQEGARYGITVNAVAPGYVDTEMVRAVPAEVLQKIIARIPIGRLGHAGGDRARRRLPDRRGGRTSSPARRCRSTAASTCTSGCERLPDVVRRQAAVHLLW